MADIRRVITCCWIVAGWAAAARGAEPPETAHVLPSDQAVRDPVTFERLLSGVEVGSNASVLKFAYFLHHRVTAPTAEGALLRLQGAWSAEKPANLRWYCIASVAAFAEMRSVPQQMSAALRDYGRLFEQCRPDMPSGAGRVLRATIREFNMSVHRGLPLTAAERANPYSDSVAPVRDVLLKAYQAYFRLLRTARDGSPEPEWEGALGLAAFDSRFRETAERAIADTKLPKSAALFRAEAAAFEVSDLARSVDLLRQGSSLLHDTSSSEVRDYYQILTRQLFDEGDLQGAVKAQKEEVDRFGWGRDGLLLLCLKAGDAPQAAQVLRDLTQPAADEDDVLHCALALVRIDNGKSGKTEFRAGYLEPILTAYLQSNRRRDNLKDVQARLLLARCCVQLGDADRAATTLSACPVMAHPKSTEEAMLYRDVQGMIQELKR